MLRTVMCAVALLVLGLGVARAEELTGVITKIDKEQVTFKEGKKGAEARTYDLAKDVKVFRFKGKKEKDLAPDGLKAEPLPNLPKGGVLAVINVVNGRVTEISIPPKKQR